LKQHLEEKKYAVHLGNFLQKRMRKNEIKRISQSNLAKLK